MSSRLGIVLAIAMASAGNAFGVAITSVYNAEGSNYGSELGGETIFVLGNGFDELGTTLVYFDGVLATDVVVQPGGYSSYPGDETMIICTSPPHAPGWVDVTVVNPDLSSGVLISAYEYRTTLTVSLVSPTLDPTNASPILVTVNFSKPVTGFVAGDLLVSNASVANFAGNGATYTFDLLPAGNGLVTAEVPDGVAQDSGGGLNSTPYAFSLKWGAYGPGDGQFISPTGVVVDNVGDVYVSDYDNHCIQKFSPTGAFLTKWGSYGTGDGQFNGPYGLAVDAGGNLYVADSSNHRIQNFTATGVFVGKWGTYGTGDGNFDTPVSVAVDSLGNVYVADVFNQRIQEFSSTGVFVTKWGTPGTGDGQFNFPVGVAVDSSNNVYVSDYNNNRIQKFGAAGTFLTKWGSYGSGDGQFSSPWGLSVDTSGNVYVADQNNNRLQRFSSNGTFLAKWGIYGSGDGQFAGPRDLAADASGNIYVADTTNVRIQKFSRTSVISRTYDGSPPTLSIGAPSSPITTAGPVTYPITYSGADAVTLSASNVTLIKTGTASTTLSVTGTGLVSRTVTLASIVGTGTLGISIAAGTATDIAGNEAAAAGPSAVFTVDNAGPEVWIVSPTLNPTTVSPIPITVGFSEPVTGFTAGNLILTNASAANFSGNGSVYSFNLLPTAPGVVTVDIPGGIVADALGNPNPPAATFTRTYSPAPTTGSLSGVVQDFDTGTRLACAAVHIASVAQGVDRVAVVNLNGDYAAPNLPAGDYVVGAYAASYNDASIGMKIVAGAQRYANFGMRPRTASSGLRGVVTDAVSGLPLVGVRVDALIGGTIVATTYTCAGGNYEIPNLVTKESTPVTVEFSSPNYETKTLETEVTPGETQDVSTPLEPKTAWFGFLAGTITNHATGLPLAGAQVTLSGAANSSTTTDAYGAYHFDALPEGTCTVSASAVNFGGQFEVVAIVPLTVKEVDFSLVPGTLETPDLFDIDGNTDVDAVDVQLVINAALGLTINGEGDVDRSGEVNAVDVQLVINAALGIETITD